MKNPSLMTVSVDRVEARVLFVVGCLGIVSRASCHFLCKSFCNFSSAYLFLFVEAEQFVHHPQMLA